MQEIRMVDLIGQHNKIKAALDAAINNVIDTTAFIRGPQVKSFEQALAKYLECKKVIGCANGTDALQLALMALELPEGAEVITADFTFVATAEVIRLLGYVPVLVDVNPDTFTIDPKAIEAAITDKTKAIIPVHLFGQSADMEAIMDIAKKHNLYVIEDTAQAIGAEFIFSDGRRQKVGTIGDIGSTSFFPSKNLGCMGDGGALFTNNAELGARMATISNHGMGEQYYYERIGVNSRLDTIQAAVLEVKLQHLDEYNKARRTAAHAYNERLAGNKNIQTPVEFPKSTHTYHQYTLKVLDGRRDELMKHLAGFGIPAKVYYPVPLHKHAPYQDGTHFDAGKLQNSIRLSEQVLSLPMHTELTTEQIDFITDKVNSFFK